MHILNLVVCVCLRRGLLHVLDGTLTQAHLQVPPDTAVPKKHLTLKKLRKAQRLREEVRAGQPDNSHSRLGCSPHMI